MDEASVNKAPSGKEKCPVCGWFYKSLAKHWTNRKCDFPELTQRQKNIATGLIMGDGTLQYKGYKNPAIEVRSVNPEFLVWLKEEFGVLSSSFGKRDVRNKEDSSNWGNKDLYGLRLRSNPYYKRYKSWYEKNFAEFPSGLKPERMSFKVWYASDGTYNSTQETLRIGCISNRKHDGITESLDDNGIKANWGASYLYFNKENSKKFLYWLGEPIPGLESKWGLQG